MNRLLQRHLLALAAVFALVSLTFAGAVVRAAPLTQATVITIKGFAFDPPTINVPVGASVTWRNEDSAPHTATARDNTFDTGMIEAGQEKTLTLDKAGTFEYFCAVHPRMVATIVVGDAQAQPSTAPSASAEPSAAPSASGEPYPSGEASAAPPAAGATPSISVSDQAIRNGTITVAQVVAAQDGWVAVHKFDANGQMMVTPLAGLAPVKAGTTTNLSITLDAAYPASAKLAPMLHIDAGTIGTYEFPNGPDTPVQANGQVVMTPFTVQAAAAAPATGAAPAPRALPNTGAEDRTALLLSVALLALLTGGGMILGLRRRTVR